MMSLCNSGQVSYSKADTKQDEISERKMRVLRCTVRIWKWQNSHSTTTGTALSMLYPSAASSLPVPLHALPFLPWPQEHEYTLPVEMY